MGLASTQLCRCANKKALLFPWKKQQKDFFEAGLPAVQNRGPKAPEVFATFFQEAPAFLDVIQVYHSRMTLERLGIDAKSCTVCAAYLPLGPRPVFQVSETARLLIISQAPGTKVHATGLPFNDASGDRLRGWMAISRDAFYDPSRIAILGMAFCYPGVLANGGDAPPRPECAPLWHEKFLRLMPAVRLTLLVGGYAQEYYLGPGSMTARVGNFAAHPGYFALPHPSWRTIGWERRNPWFGEMVVPALRTAITHALMP